MTQWVIGYVVGMYPAAPGLGATIPLDLPGPLRRINAAFYLHGNSVTPHPLAPVETADGNGEVQISDPTTSAGKRAIRIFLDVPVNDLVVFLFVEIELDYPGTKHAILP